MAARRHLPQQLVPAAERVGGGDRLPGADVHHEDHGRRAAGLRQLLDRTHERARPLAQPAEAGRHAQAEKAGLPQGIEGLSGEPASRIHVRRGGRGPRAGDLRRKPRAASGFTIQAMDIHLGHPSTPGQKAIVHHRIRAPALEWRLSGAAVARRGRNAMDPLCFACEGTGPEIELERAHHWVLPRRACAEHMGAGLLEDGTALAEVLNTHWPDELDGAGANLLLNPVRLGGRRAWLDVTTRGRCVLEEVFPASDYFEFAALHLPPYVDVLFEVRDLARFAHREPLGMMAALAVDNARYTALQALQALWSSTRALRGLMPGAGMPRPASLADAARLWADARAQLALADPDPDHLRVFLMALLPLASRRFVHLRSTAPA